MPLAHRRPRSVVRAWISSVAALAVCMGAVAAPGRPAPEPPPLEPATEPTYDSHPEEQHLLDTPGGPVYVRLRRPRAEHPVPIILTMTPYAALGVNVVDQWIARGYARAVADVPGTGESGGCWDYGGARERAAAATVVDWLGSQPWANGKVGMIGASYDGTTANMAAVADTKHLVTIVPEVAISDWYGYAFHDGVRYFVMDPVQRQGLVIDEQGFDTPVSFDAVYGLAPPRTSRSQPRYDEKVIGRLCPGTLDKIQHTARGYDPDPDFDGFWQERSYIRNVDALVENDISVLVQGGWRDYNVKHSESSRWFRAIPVDDPTTEADEGVPFTMLVMGQGAHGAVEPDLDYDRILHAWFDHFLYGFDTNITEQHRSVSRTQDGVVRRDATWPPAATREVSLYLEAGGGLTLEPPGALGGASTLVDSGASTESSALAALASGGAADVLWFVSEPLAAAARIAGTPRLDLFASTAGTSTHFTPVLFDLGPPANRTDSLCTFAPPADACVISRGFLNARHRDGLERGRDLTPLEPYRAAVRFIDNDWVVPAGHRIGVAVMSSNLWWALPDQVRAATSVRHDAAAPSALVLPVVGDFSFRT